MRLPGYAVGQGHAIIGRDRPEKGDRGLLEWQYVVLLGAVGLVVVLWQAQLRAWERARGAVARRCKKLNVQLLDDTVVLRRIRLDRDAGGQWRFFRIYGFEYTEDGFHRQPGRLIMAGGRVQAVEMDNDLIAP